MRSAAVFSTAICLAALLNGCAAPAPPSPSPPLSPLAGEIYDAATGAPLPGVQALTARLVGAQYIVLGETHDNPAHHAGQALIVGALRAAASGGVAGIAFEMIPRMREARAQAALDGPGGADAVGPAIDWAGGGWPDWRVYAPILAAAPGARVAGGGLARADLRRAYEAGAAAALDPADAARMGLDVSPPAAVVAAMTREQIAVHCGLIPEPAAARMVNAQRARDAAFAEALLRARGPGPGPGVLITGAGHARTDRGAPFYLRTAAPGARIVSLAFVEASADWPDWAAFAAQFGGAFDRASAAQSGNEAGNESGGAVPYDYVWFTEPFARDDPCQAMRARFKAGAG